MKKEKNKKTTLRSGVQVNNIDVILDEYINSSSAKTRNKFKHKLRVLNSDAVIRKLEKRLKASSGETKYKLLQLGVYLERQKYLFLLLNAMEDGAHQLDKINLLDQFNNSPLTSHEQNEIARHIANNPRYDYRLLDYLQPSAMKIALDGILDDAKNNGLKPKHLLALNKQEEYINAVQNEIRKALTESPFNHRNMARYLNLQDINNQRLLSDLYSYQEIYIQLKRNKTRHLSSQYFSVRVALDIIHKMPIAPEDWDNLRTMVTQDVNSTEKIDEGSSLLELLEDLCFYDYTYSEALLISLHMRSSLNTNAVISTLTKIKSPFAYRELLGILMKTENINERYRSAVSLIRNYPEKAPLIMHYTSELGDMTLKKRIAEEIPKMPLVKPRTQPIPLLLSKEEPYALIPRDTDICQILYDIVCDIEATDFFVAVGFAFSSGLQLLAPVFNYIHTKNGHLELILGSLQTYNSGEKTNKINRNTAKKLNELMDTYKLQLFTYEDSFFHGKFYYVGNSTTAYVIVGSSNISRTAFFANREIDILFKLDLKAPEKQCLSTWFEEFKSRCVQIYNLDETKFTDFSWNSELDAFSERIIKKLSNQDVRSRLSKLDDEETKFRIELWMAHNPTEKLTNLGIDSLKGYIAFVYEEYSLAVFEAFDPAEAYYVFRCTDFDQLMRTISGMSKSEIATYSLDFVKKGYHIQDRERLKEIIDRLFAQQRPDF